jgi:hypothetical protein
MLPVPVSHVSCAYVISNRVANYNRLEFMETWGFLRIAAVISGRSEERMQYFAQEGES